MDQPSSVLIVDDDGAVTETFSRMLRLEGYRVQIAVNGEEGLRRLANESVDGIILDLRMPIVDGLSFLERLRSGPQPLATPVALVTGDYFIDDSTIESIRSLGASVHFKPLWLDDLVAIARELVVPPPDAARPA